LAIHLPLIEDGRLLAKNLLKLRRVIIIYQAYYNLEALELHEWALECRNRVKASKMIKIATKLEDTYRKTHIIPKNCLPSPVWRPNI